MQIVVVVVNRLKPFTHASPRLLGNHYGAVVRGFFFDPTIRGHDLPLENVDATDSDKRVEQGVCLLGNFGAVKTLVGQNPYKLDKREHLTLVDNLGTTSLIVPSIRSLKAWRNEKTTCKF